jgi:predicted nucleic acid-binding protein
VRVFFDTTVLVSAFLARGLGADLLRLVLTEHTLVTSAVVLAELRDVLNRKGRLPSQQVDAIETFLREQPVAPWPSQTLALGLIDADHEWVLASAVFAQADLFVTGDQGVLACSNPPLPLLNPRGCWEQLRGAGSAKPLIAPSAALRGEGEQVVAAAVASAESSTGFGGRRLLFHGVVVGAQGSKALLVARVGGLRLGDGAITD